MTIVAITGADGFLGWHLRCRLLADAPDTTVLPLDRAAFADGRLEQAVGTADVVIHLAAVNSHDPDLAAMNDGITDRLLDALGSTDHSPDVVVANSIHARNDSAFGAAKRRVVERLRAWGTERGASISDVILPNLFGECGRPRHNSVVATMCDALSRGTTVTIDREGHTTLVHAQDAARVLLRAAATCDDVTTIDGRHIAVPDLFDRLTVMHRTYATSHEIPILNDTFDLRLFNQLRAAMFDVRPTFPLATHRDPRGSYAELVRSNGTSQVSVSVTVPGQRRGEHFHVDKIERFCVISGRARIRVRRLFDDRIATFDVDGDDRIVIDMPTLHTHDLMNIGDVELVTVFWTNGHFDPSDPDTHREVVDIGAAT